MAIGFVKYVPCLVRFHCSPCLPTCFTSAFANLSSVYGSYIWPSSTAPEYAPGFTVTIVLMFATAVTAFFLMVLTKKYPYENAEEGETGPSSEATN